MYRAFRQTTQAERDQSAAHHPIAEYTHCTIGDILPLERQLAMTRNPAGNRHPCTKLVMPPQGGGLANWKHYTGCHGKADCTFAPLPIDFCVHYAATLQCPIQLAYMAAGATASKLNPCAQIHAAFTGSPHTPISLSTPIWVCRNPAFFGEAHVWDTGATQRQLDSVKSRGAYYDKEAADYYTNTERVKALKAEHAAYIALNSRIETITTALDDKLATSAAILADKAVERGQGSDEAFATIMGGEQRRHTATMAARSEAAQAKLNADRVTELRRLEFLTANYEERKAKRDLVNRQKREREATGGAPPAASATSLLNPTLQPLYNASMTTPERPPAPTTYIAPMGAQLVGPSSTGYSGTNGGQRFSGAGPTTSRASGTFMGHIGQGQPHADSPTQPPVAETDMMAILGLSPQPATATTPVTMGRPMATMEEEPSLAQKVAAIPELPDYLKTLMSQHLAGTQDVVSFMKQFPAASIEPNDMPAYKKAIVLVASESV
jgi:hypothetical protein